MINRISNIINKTSDIDGDILHVNGHVVSDLECLSFLEEHNCINEILYNGNIVDCQDIKNGDCIDIKCSLMKLSQIGYYYSCSLFITNNKYCFPANDFHITEIGNNSCENKEFLLKYKSIISLVYAIKTIAKHSYRDIDTDIVIIFREDKSLFLSLIYDESDIKSIYTQDAENISRIANIFQEVDSDKKFLFINELIEFLSGKEEQIKFKYLLGNANDFLTKANNAYLYYIRNFSYNKMKTELNSVILDYSRKIQSVINDAQTKLIAIPVAFILTATSMSFKTVDSTKNIILVISLFVFTILIEIFLRNQNSALNMIKNDIKAYKATFSNNNQVVAESFAKVDKEFNKQEIRLNAIRTITWAIPISLTIVLIYLFFNNQ